MSEASTKCLHPLGCRNAEELCSVCVERARNSILHHAKKHLLPVLKRNESFMNFLDELPHISMRSEIEKFVKRLHMFLAHVNAHLNLRMRVIKKDQVKQALSVQEKLLYVMKRLNRVARRFLGYTEPLPISGGV